MVKNWDKVRKDYDGALFNRVAEQAWWLVFNSRQGKNFWFVNKRHRFWKTPINLPIQGIKRSLQFIKLRMSEILLVLRYYALIARGLAKGLFIAFCSNFEKGLFSCTPNEYVFEVWMNFVS